MLVISVGESLREGPPNPFKQPLGVQLEFVGLFGIWAGMIVGWKWEGIAAALVVGGVMIFHIVEGKLWLSGVFGLFGFVGVLFLFCWWLRKPQMRKAICGEKPYNKGQ